jgi:hypothetical protein
MKRVLIIPVALVFLMSCNSAKKSVSNKNAYADTAIVVDGDNSEWPTPYPYYDEKAGIGYDLSNDKDNLYITVKTADEKVQVKMLRGGLNVWVDVKGEKNLTTVINYPIENNNSSPKTESPVKQSPQQRRMEAIENARDYTLSGFKKCNGGLLINQANSCGIKVKMGVNEFNELVWEAAIPFTALYGRKITVVDTHKPISVCFDIKGLKQAAGSNSARGGGMGGGMRGGGMGGGMRGGGGRMGGGGNSGTNNPGGAADRQKLFEPTKTWVKTTLAFKP